MSDALTRPRGGLRGYLDESRNPLNTVLLLLPVFVIYSIGILTTGGVCNGVDLASDLLRGRVFGGNDWHYFLFNVAVGLGFVLMAVALRHKHTFSPRLYLLVLAEATAYGALLGVVIGNLLVRIGIRPSMLCLGTSGPPPLGGALLGAAGLGGPAGVLAAAPPLAAGAAQFGPWDSFVLSLGAGLWEELVFRLLILGGLVLFMRQVLGLRASLAWLVGIILSSLAFSWIHYTGSLADTFTLYSFMFRFVAGVIFALIFYKRGLAVAVYTHAVYDIMVMVF